MLYSVSTGTTWMLFRIRVSENGEPQGEAQQSRSATRLTAGTGLVGLLGGDARCPRTELSLSPRLLYNGFLFTFSVDEAGRRLGPGTQVDLAHGPLYYSPSLSRDGRWMTYSMGASGQPNTLMLRNLLTGTERMIREEPGLPRPSSSGNLATRLPLRSAHRLP